MVWQNETEAHKKNVSYYTTYIWWQFLDQMVLLKTVQYIWKRGKFRINNKNLISLRNGRVKMIFNFCSIMFKI